MHELVDLNIGVICCPSAALSMRQCRQFLSPTFNSIARVSIKEIRKFREISQEQLAEKVDLDSKFISKIEVGRSSPSLETIENIARALEVEIRDLFEFMHLQLEEITAERIYGILSEMDERTSKVIYKMLRQQYGKGNCCLPTITG